MATSFNDIEELALATINDPDLNTLYKLDKEAFYKRMDSFLICGVPNFKTCFNSLEYDLLKRQFVEDLTNDEVYILACFTSISWLESKIQDTTQMSLHLQGRAFKTHSEAQNLKAKQDWSILKNERISQLIVEYQLANIDKIPFYGGNK